MFLLIEYKTSIVRKTGGFVYFFQGQERPRFLHSQRPPSLVLDHSADTVGMSLLRGFAGRDARLCHKPCGFVDVVWCDMI